MIIMDINVIIPGMIMTSRFRTWCISHHAHNPFVTITMSIILGIIMIILYMVKVILDNRCPENHKVVILVGSSPSGTLLVVNPKQIY